MVVGVGCDSLQAVDHGGTVADHATSPAATAVGAPSAACAMGAVRRLAASSILCQDLASAPTKVHVAGVAGFC